MDQCELAIFEDLKNAVFAILEALIFVNLVDFIFQNSEPLNVLKRQILHF